MGAQCAHSFDLKAFTPATKAFRRGNKRRPSNISSRLNRNLPLPLPRPLAPCPVPISWLPFYAKLLCILRFKHIFRHATFFIMLWHCPRPDPVSLRLMPEINCRWYLNSPSNLFRDNLRAFMANSFMIFMHDIYLNRLSLPLALSLVRLTVNILKKVFQTDKILLNLRKFTSTSNYKPNDRAAFLTVICLYIKKLVVIAYLLSCLY